MHEGSVLVGMNFGKVHRRGRRGAAEVTERDGKR